MLHLKRGLNRTREIITQTRWRNQRLNSPISYQFFPLIPPEDTREPRVFWRVPGDEKGKLGLNALKNEFLNPYQQLKNKTKHRDRAVLTTPSHN